MVTIDSDNDPEYSSEKNLNEKKSKFDESLEGLGISPIKLHGISSNKRQSTAKRKLSKIVKNVEINVAEVYNIDVSEVSESKISINRDVQQKANNFDRLMVLIKEKIKDCRSYQKKLQLLTLCPDSWSRKYASEYFGVSEYLVRKSRSLKGEKGILAESEPKAGKSLLSSTVDLVLNFYEDDEYSHMMPGKKDYISIKGEQRQKRLLLCNLRELYAEFKGKYPDILIGFSKFASLRPKWCVSVGASGTHSVCVCTHHQNAVLLISSYSWKVTYKDLMSNVKCDISEGMHGS